MWVAGIEEDLVLVLTVQIDQACPTSSRSARARGERAVDERPAAALGGDLAPER